MEKAFFTLSYFMSFTLTLIAKKFVILSHMCFNSLHVFAGTQNRPEITVDCDKQATSRSFSSLLLIFIFISNDVLFASQVQQQKNDT